MYNAVTSYKTKIMELKKTSNFKIIMFRISNCQGVAKRYKYIGIILQKAKVFFILFLIHAKDGNFDASIIKDFLNHHFHNRPAKSILSTSNLGQRNFRDVIFNHMFLHVGQRFSEVVVSWLIIAPLLGDEVVNEPFFDFNGSNVADLQIHLFQLIDLAWPFIPEGLCKSSKKFEVLAYTMCKTCTASHNIALFLVKINLKQLNIYVRF